MQGPDARWGSQRPDIRNRTGGVSLDASRAEDEGARDTGLRLLLEILQRLESLHVRDSHALTSIWRARATVVRARSVKGEERDLLLAQELLGRIEQVLASLGEKRDALAEDPRSLAARPAYLHEFQTVRDLYLEALAALLEPRAIELFTRAEQAAVKLPRALLDVELKRLASRPASHSLLEPSRRDLTEWVGWLRSRLDMLEDLARRLAEARRAGGAEAPRWEHALRTLEETVQLSVEALGHWEQALDAHEALARGGNVLPQAYASVGRVVARCREMKEAALAERLEVLRERVRRHRDDPDVATFLRGLPGVVSGSRLLVGLGVTLVASVATAGVGSLVSGALGAARVGAGLSFAGTVAVESLTFTTVSRGVQSLIPGEAASSPFWTELAWSLGLFSAMRGLSLGVRALVRDRGMPALAEASLQKGSAFALLQAYGALHQRVASGQWPTEDEWRTMTAHNLVLMTGLALGLQVVQGVLPGLGGNSARVRFSRAHGARFRALAEVRSRVETSYRELQKRGRPTPVEVESLRGRARALEEELRQLVAVVEKDPRLDLQALREEWAGARGLAEEASAELLARMLDIANAQDALRLLGGERQYSYAWGRTNNLETRFRSLGAKVHKSMDASTRLRSMTVHFGEEAPLTLVERPSPYPALREVEIDPKAPEVRKLFEEFGITSPKIKRYVLRDIATELSKNPKAGLTGPVRVVRRRLQWNGKGARSSPQEKLRLERHLGRLRSSAEPNLVRIADRLEKNGILSTPEWMDGRDEGNLRGIVGEALAVQDVLASIAKDSSVLTRVRFQGRLFKDSAMTQPLKASDEGAIDVTSELDLLVVTEFGGRFRFSRIANVKVTDPQSAKVFRAEAKRQNQMAMDALQAHHERKPVKVETQSGQNLYGDVSSIFGYDARTGGKVVLTGRIEPAEGAIRADTILPRVQDRPEAMELKLTYQEIHSVTNLLLERQFKKAGGD